MKQDKTIVIALLQGGLGNQMFQYALARSLADRNSPSEIVLDTSRLKLVGPASMGYAKRDYALGPFSIAARVGTIQEIASDARFVVQVVQRQRGFHADILDIRARGVIVLEGYWASERYFLDIKKTIRDEFVFHDENLGFDNVIAPIRSAESVSIHIRRGDYLMPAGEHLGFLGMDYYRVAMADIASRATRPHFFVFSDDIAWCKRNFVPVYPHTYVDHPDGSDQSTHREFNLMRACRHHIVANSTFSWWAAWLSDSPGKCVLAPKRWLADPDADCADIVPTSWITL